MKANLHELQSRGDDCLKLRQLAHEERRFYYILQRHKTRIEANAALAEQLAKLHRMVAQGIEIVGDAAGNHDDRDAAGDVNNEGGEVEELQEGSGTTAKAQPSEHVKGRDPIKNLDQMQQEMTELAAAQKYVEAAAVQAEINQMELVQSTEKEILKTDNAKSKQLEEKQKEMKKLLEAQQYEDITKCGECHASRQSLPPQRTLRTEKSDPEAPAKKQNRVAGGTGKCR